MRSSRNFITFDADLPDDSQWDAREVLLVPGGRTIAQVLHEFLCKRGYLCSDVAQHSFYGWVFGASNKTGFVRCLVQYPGPWLLMCEKSVSFLDRLFRRTPEPAPQEFLDTVYDVLSTDRRFSKVRWFTRDDFLRGDDSRWADRP